MTSIYLENNSTFSNINDVDLKIFVDGEDDEGIDCPLEVPPEHTCQTTPTIASESASRCDSGYGEPGASAVDLRCLENARAWCSDRNPPRTTGQCPRAWSREFDGFEQYMHEIFTHRLSIEAKYHVKACLDNQPEITPEGRRRVIRWLTSVHHELGLYQDTLFLAVHVHDRVLDVMQVSHDCIELLAVTCLLVASKQNEICPPEIHELLEKCHENYSREQVKQLELIVLMATSFDLLAPTVQQFFEYFSSISLAAAGDHPTTNRYTCARALGRYVLELALQDYTLSRIRPSLLALCVWQTAAHTQGTTLDTRTLQRICDITPHALDACLVHVTVFFESFMSTCPNISSLCEKYGNLYGPK